MIVSVLKDGALGQAEIAPIAKSQIPLKRNGWQFNWNQIVRKAGLNEIIYTLRILATNTIEGVIHLRLKDGLYEMEHLEIAPHNIGRSHKRFEDVAGCLIAFGCLESLRLETVYKGALSFIPKTGLENWYIEQYGAERGLGRRMFFWESTPDLISRYIYRE